MIHLRTPSGLMVTAVLILAAVLGAVTWHSARQAALLGQDDFSRFVDRQAGLIASAVGEAVQRGDRQRLLDVLEALATDGHVRYAALFNDRLERLAAAGDPPPLRQSVTSGPRRIQHSGDGLEEIEVPVQLDGRNVGMLQLGYHSAHVHEAARAAMRSTMVLLVLALGGCAVAGALASLPLNRSVVRLRAALEQVEGESDHRLPATPGLLSDVRDRVNALLDQARAGRAELRQQFEQAAKEARHLKGLLHGVNAVVWEVDPQSGHFIYVSEEAEALTGLSRAAWLEPDFCDRHVHPTDRDWLRGFLTHFGNATHSFNLDFRLLSGVSESLWLRMIATVEVRDQGPVLTGLMLNVSEEKRSEQRIAYLADHDPLTGLINRRRFQEKIEEQIAYNQRYQGTGALLFMDLDQFKYVNDTYGHHTGDEYLRQVSHHLRSALRKTDTIGRLGGDEFGILLPKVDESRAARVCEGLLKYLNSHEFIHEGRRTPFTASIGVAMFPSHGDKAGELLAKADSAMYSAKDQGRNAFRIYDEGIDSARMREKIHWEARIRGALQNERFMLYFQPIVDLQTGHISHYESLLRMRGENDEVIAPGAFIGVAERFGLIRAIDRWVVAAALRAQGRSESSGRPVSLTINLSGRHFGSREIVDVIRENTERFGADPSNVVFEVTETAAVENFTEACDFIRELRQMGYRFALDDFGAGFSSFDYLKHMPVDYVKIDGSFVRNLASDKVDRIFVNAINEMARGLGVKTIAEFVENQGIVDALRALNVPYGQGYFFARPSPRFHEHGRIIITPPEPLQP